MQKYFIALTFLVLFARGHEVVEAETGEISEAAPPKPPNSPEQACIRALSLVGKTPGWKCNQYVNWAYFNDINKGGGPLDYAQWPKIAEPKSEGTVVYGISTINVGHVGMVCKGGSLFCEEPNYNGMAIRCTPISQIGHHFKSHSYHYPPGY